MHPPIPEKERYAMKDTTITTLVQPGEFSDHLSDVLRSGAQALLAQAVEAEVAGFLERHEQERLGDGRARLVRHGHLPEREIQTGIGAVTVKQPSTVNANLIPHRCDLGRIVRRGRIAFKMKQNSQNSPRMSQNPAHPCLREQPKSPEFGKRRPMCNTTASDISIWGISVAI